MKLNSTATASALVLAISSTLSGQETPPATAPPASAPESPPTVKNWFEEKLPDAIARGKPHLNTRARYEWADQNNLRVSHAFTFRTRLGYETAPLYGFKGMLEFEDVRIIGNDDNFNQAGLSGAGKTPVLDVEDTEINQAWISYENWDSVAKVGRQRILLDNHRFIGNVGWRQNEQTFDALSLQNKSIKDTTLFYSYIHNVNRVLSDEHPMGNFHSDSHLIHGSYTGCPYGAISAYSYALAFENSAPNSSATFGLNFSGSQTIDKETATKLNYRAEYAFQTDYRNQPIDYEAHYYNLELGGDYQRFSAGAGYEVLGSDNGKGFATPLATLHAFNGWADVFAPATPAAGLRDIYAWAGVMLPYKTPFRVIYHKFCSDRGSLDFGSEWDAVASHKFGKHWTALAKYAYYDGEDAPFAFTLHRFWMQVEFAF